MTTPLLLSPSVLDDAEYLLLLARERETPRACLPDDKTFNRGRFFDRQKAPYPQLLYLTHPYRVLNRSTIASFDRRLINLSHIFTQGPLPDRRCSLTQTHATKTSSAVLYRSRRLKRSRPRHRFIARALSLCSFSPASEITKWID